MKWRRDRFIWSGNPCPSGILAVGEEIGSQLLLPQRKEFNPNLLSASFSRTEYLGGAVLSPGTHSERQSADSPFGR